jgi:hypothetical protein
MPNHQRIALGQGKVFSAPHLLFREPKPQLAGDYNEHADAFVWTRSAVHQKTLKPCFASAIPGTSKDPPSYSPA